MSLCERASLGVCMHVCSVCPGQHSHVQVADGPAVLWAGSLSEGQADHAGVCVCGGGGTMQMGVCGGGGTVQVSVCAVGTVQMGVCAGGTVQMGVCTDRPGQVWARQC